MIEFLGKLHPLFVHLPIGVLLLLGALEWLALKPKHKDLAAANRVILLFCLPTTLASVICGWLLAASGGYDAKALFWHRWLGTALFGAVLLLWCIRQRGWLTAYRRGLLATLVLLTVASHFGGTLTHGSDFLSWQKRKVKPTAIATGPALLSQPVYATAIQPLFDEYCVSCHGETKLKGGLRLDTAEYLRAGGDSGSALEPAGTDSLLGKRVTLPLDDDDHMPPDGKPQLSKAQIATLLWWLNSGAPTDGTQFETLKPGADVLRSIQTALSGSASQTENID